MTKQQQTVSETMHYWCGGCRDSGAIHCAHPEDCGEMDRKKPMSLIESDPSYQRYLARTAKARAEA
jgi:hypothetical protein